MTAEELEVTECLDKIFKYCRKHKDSCEGCVFYREMTIGELQFVSCRVMHAPDIFGNDTD